LFATAEDAQKAVTMYNGYEWHGRTLKVHFDKFVSNGPNSPMFNSPMSYPLPSPGLHHPHMQPMMMTTPFGPMSPISLDPPQSIFQTHDNSMVQVQPIAPIGAELAAANNERKLADMNNGLNGVNNDRPGSISLPPNPFGFSGPFSPQTGQMPLMTPSLPGFSFHPYPQTPPLVAQYLSPGVGPFSPVMHSSPVYHPSNVNPAPGVVHHQVVGINHHGYFPTVANEAYSPFAIPQPIPVEDGLNEFTPTSTTIEIKDDRPGSSALSSAEISPVKEMDSFVPGNTKVNFFGLKKSRDSTESTNTTRDGDSSTTDTPPSSAPADVPGHNRHSSEVLTGKWSETSALATEDEEDVGNGLGARRATHNGGGEIGNEREKFLRDSKAVSGKNTPVDYNPWKKLDLMDGESTRRASFGDSNNRKMPFGTSIWSDN
jgi:hypothetical protein